MELHIPLYLNVTMTYFGEKLFVHVEGEKNLMALYDDGSYYRSMYLVIYNILLKIYII